MHRGGPLITARGNPIGTVTVSDRRRTGRVALAYDRDTGNYDLITTRVDVPCDRSVIERIVNETEI